MKLDLKLDLSFAAAKLAVTSISPSAVPTPVAVSAEPLRAYAGQPATAPLRVNTIDAGLLSTVAEDTPMTRKQADPENNVFSAWERATKAALLIQEHYRAWMFRREMQQLVLSLKARAAERKRARATKKGKWRKVQAGTSARALGLKVKEEYASRRAAEIIESGRIHTWVSTAKELRALPKSQQGDISLYSHDNLKKRLQLRDDAAVTAAIDRWWECLPKTYEAPAPGDAEPEAANAPEAVITREDYLHMACLIQLAVLEDADERRLTEPDYQSAEDDWKADSRGLAGMPRLLFQDALYEFADVWVDTVDGTDYVTFLDKILRMCCDPSGAWPPNRLRDLPGLALYLAGGLVKGGEDVGGSGAGNSGTGDKGGSNVRGESVTGTSRADRGATGARDVAGRSGRGGLAAGRGRSSRGFPPRARDSSLSQAPGGSSKDAKPRRLISDSPRLSAGNSGRAASSAALGVPIPHVSSTGDVVAAAAAPLPAPGGSHASEAAWFTLMDGDIIFSGGGATESDGQIEAGGDETGGDDAVTGKIETGETGKTGDAETTGDAEATRDAVQEASLAATLAAAAAMVHATPVTKEATADPSFYWDPYAESDDDDATDARTALPKAPRPPGSPGGGGDGGDGGVGGDIYADLAAGMAAIRVRRSSVTALGRRSSLVALTGRKQSSDGGSTAGEGNGDNGGGVVGGAVPALDLQEELLQFQQMLQVGGELDFLGAATARAKAEAEAAAAAAAADDLLPETNAQAGADTSMTGGRGPFEARGTGVLWGDRPPWGDPTLGESHEAGWGSHPYPSSHQVTPWGVDLLGGYVRGAKAPLPRFAELSARLSARPPPPAPPNRDPPSLLDLAWAAEWDYSEYSPVEAALAARDAARAMRGGGPNHGLYHGLQPPPLDSLGRPVGGYVTSVGKMHAAAQVAAGRSHAGWIAPVRAPHPASSSVVSPEASGPAPGARISRAANPPPRLLRPFHGAAPLGQPPPRGASPGEVSPATAAEARAALAVALETMTAAVAARVMPPRGRTRLLGLGAAAAEDRRAAGQTAGVAGKETPVVPAVVPVIALTPSAVPAFAPTSPSAMPFKPPPLPLPPPPSRSAVLPTPSSLTAPMAAPLLSSRSALDGWDSNRRPAPTAPPLATRGHGRGRSHPVAASAVMGGALGVAITGRRLEKRTASGGSPQSRGGGSRGGGSRGSGSRGGRRPLDGSVSVTRAATAGGAGGVEQAPASVKVMGGQAAGWEASDEVAMATAAIFTPRGGMLLPPPRSAPPPLSMPPPLASHAANASTQSYWSHAAAPPPPRSRGDDSYVSDTPSPSRGPSPSPHYDAAIAAAVEAIIAAATAESVVAGPVVPRLALATLSRGGSPNKRAPSRGRRGGSRRGRRRRRAPLPGGPHMGVWVAQQYPGPAGDDATSARWRSLAMTGDDSMDVGGAFLCAVGAYSNGHPMAPTRLFWPPGGTPHTPPDPRMMPRLQRAPPPPPGAPPPPRPLPVGKTPLPTLQLLLPSVLPSKGPPPPHHPPPLPGQLQPVWGRGDGGPRRGGRRDADADIVTAARRLVAASWPPPPYLPPPSVARMTTIEAVAAAAVPRPPLVLPPLPASLLTPLREAHAGRAFLLMTASAPLRAAATGRSKA